jgi:hypothetical protein
MKDPLRLVDAGGTEFERLLLTTAAEEAPTSEVSARMVAGMATAGAAVALFSGVAASGSQLVGEGIAASGIAASGALQAGSSAAALVGAGSSIAPPAAAAGAWLVKWGVIGALVAGGAVSGIHLLEVGEQSAHEPATSVRRGAAPAALSMAGPASAAAGPSEAGQPEALAAGVPPTEADQVPVDRVRARPSSSRERGPQTGTQALGPEIDLLDSARRALAEGQAERALTLLASYHRRFPSGALSQEATVLEVDALEAKGRAAQATDLKQQFLAEHPESAHTQRVQRSGQAR